MFWLLGFDPLYQIQTDAGCSQTTIPTLLTIMSFFSLCIPEEILLRSRANPDRRIIIFSIYKTGKIWYLQDKQNYQIPITKPFKEVITMGAFPNPFAGNVSRKMSNAELMQALRFDISGELEAIFLYDAHYHATDDPAAKAILADIRDEEKVHVGELITLMRYLDPHEAECFLEGEAEVHEMLEKLGLKGQSEGIAPAEGPTVGSLVK